jgi:hypothetical protein
MSRLESFIRRLQAQRDCLALAASLIAGVPGPVLELGLGNGRTFDHLRRLLPGREIFVFDRHLAAHADCRPDERHLFLGELAETLPRARAAIGAPAALAHCDLGSGDPARDRALAAAVGPGLAPLMAPGGVVVGDQDYGVAGWRPVAPPPDVAPGRYFIYRVGPGEGR